MAMIISVSLAGCVKSSNEPRDNVDDKVKVVVDRCDFQRSFGTFDAQMLIVLSLTSKDGKSHSVTLDWEAGTKDGTVFAAETEYGLRVNPGKALKGSLTADLDRGISEATVEGAGTYVCRVTSVRVN